MFSLEQQSNRTLYLPIPTNYDAFDDPQPDVPVTPSFIKTYYIQLPRGGGVSDNMDRDIELWQSWRKTFGFQKIPIGFGVYFIIGVGRGTQVGISYSGDLDNPTYQIIRFNKWDILFT